MSLRTRLLLGYGLLTVVLLASVCGAAIVLHTLGRAIDQVLEENLASVRVAARLNELLERHNTMIFQSLTGQEPIPPQQQEREFFDALREAERNITVAGEREAIGNIESAYRDFGEASARFLAAPRGDPLSQYEAEVAPALATCKAKLQQLFDLNIEAIQRADRNARRLAMRASLALATLAGVALILLPLASSQIHRHLYQPLAAMQQAAEAMAAGDSRRRLPTLVDRDLGQLATTLNSAFAERDNAAGRARGVLAQQRQLLLGLLASLGEPAALIGLDGAVVAATLDDETTQALTASQPALRAASSSLPQGQQTTPFTLRLNEGLTVHCQLLLAPPDRAVGWLVRRS